MSEEQYFDKHGQPIDYRSWVILMEDPEYYVIDRTVVDAVLVSTVWLGQGEGRMFETMVFWVSTNLNKHGDSDALPSARYPTLEEAKAGHLAEVKRQREQAGVR